MGYGHSDHRSAGLLLGVFLLRWVSLEDVGVTVDDLRSVPENIANLAIVEDESYNRIVDIKPRCQVISPATIS